MSLVHLALNAETIRRRRGSLHRSLRRTSLPELTHAVSRVCLIPCAFEYRAGNARGKTVGHRQLGANQAHASGSSAIAASFLGFGVGHRRLIWISAFRKSRWARDCLREIIRAGCSFSIDWMHAAIVRRKTRSMT